MKIKALFYSILIIFICAISVYIGIKIYMHTTGLSISEQGATGDSFNGFVSPFIAAFSGLLVYFAFKEQVKANVLLMSNSQLETFTKLLFQIKEQVDELEFCDKIFFENEVNDEIKNTYVFNEEKGIYTKTYNGSSAILGFSFHLSRKRDEKIGWYQKEFIKSLVLVYEDIILLERFIQNSKGENVKYFYLKLNFYFQLAIESSFTRIYEILKDYKGEFFYMTIFNMEKVRVILNGYQITEQRQFIELQEKIARKEQIQIDLEKVKGKKP